MPARIVETAAAVIVGNEILSGKVQDANLVELARALRRQGIQLSRVVTLPDDPTILSSELHALSAQYDVVFTSGGIGPTHDDITLEAICLAFELESVEHPVLVAHLREAYGDRITEHHLTMARVPTNAELMTTDSVRWPTVVVGNIWLLPGIPEIFRRKLEVVEHWLKGPNQFVSRSVTLMLDEPELKPFLDLVVAAHPNVTIGSYPDWSGERRKTKVTFDSVGAREADAALDRFVAQLPTDVRKEAT